MRSRRNWSAVSGLLLGIGAVVTYFQLILTCNPTVHRFLDTPVLNLGVLVIGIVLSLIGVRQALQRTHRGRILAPILAALNVGLGALFVWFLFVHTAHMPVAARSPSVGAIAPDFTLRDQSNNELRLSSLRGHPVVLIFYRGFW